MLPLAHSDSTRHALVESLVALGHEARVAGDQAGKCLLAVQDRSAGRRVRRCDRRTCWALVGAGRQAGATGSGG
jgi:hypothetical protein